MIAGSGLPCKYFECLDQPKFTRRSWTFHNYHPPGVYGEIDILEGFNDIIRNHISLHTSANCTFKSSINKQT
ncbi:hypothetical protein BKA65DRAFT_263137 [Rhexocercosporidium sp. MPI-PUGE-AT-0058]|nr:hypothetical protein BKA65DRAFT_263137 [Rhexocercosporidium sp. MPI-PUGE-AT-0058]